jgi:trimeric autotransporter adhesin
MSKLIGTNANQVPSNADLGTAAFMDKTEFLLSKGSELSAINTIIPKTAVDVFVYDTSRDSDGGAWRKRTQHTSWYNETLNTATRGSRKEFPAVAVIVAESNKVTIYDGDDPALPMWMVFNQGGSYATSNNLIGATSATNSAISSLNGILSLTTSTEAIYVIKLISDKSQRITNTADREYLGGIGERNSGKGLSGSNSTNYIVNENCNDVAMTVLPNAPIDPITGLQVPTIAVATNGGVSVIKDDGNVWDIRGSNWAAAAGSVMFDRNGVLYFSQTIYYWLSCDVKNLNQDYTALPDGRPYYQVAADTPPFKQVSCYDNISWQGTLDPAASSNTDFDLVHAAQNTSYPGNRIVRHYNDDKTVLFLGDSQLLNYTSTTYNTGWMYGDIKGAWLSNSTQETVISTELVTNGTFDTDTSGWTVDGVTTVVNSGQVTLTGSGDLTQQISVVSGKTYVISADVIAVNNCTANLKMNTDSTGSGGIVIQNRTDAGSLSGTFVANSSSTYIAIQNGGASSSSTTTWDNVSIRLADADRSVNNKGLQVYGLITKTPVATGADLVAYSGFSANNYLEQPYNSALDFGTGDFCVMFWAKVTASGGYYCYTSRLSSTGGTGWNISKSSDNTMYLYTRTATTVSSSPTLGYPTQTGIWNLYCFTRLSNGTIEKYENGRLMTSTPNVSRDVSFSTSKLLVGEIVDFSQDDNPGSISLLRISATVPTAEQIKKIYNDEKFLFQDNAQATLYGTSDAITALAYDDKTNLLHVGTSSGRSVFQGLQRIDNTTTAVGTAISAYDSLVVEE